MASFQPIESPERLQVVDALRGLALLGILIANVPISAANAWQGQRNWVIGGGQADKALEFIYQLLIEKKFITIFSMLFGFGFYVQLRRAEERGIAFRPYYLKRMLILLAIGCLHAYLLWMGDIVRDYAICGIFLLLVYRWKPKKVLLTAILFSVLLTATVFILNGILGLPSYSYDTALVAEHPLTGSYARYLYINARIDPFVNFINDSPITLVFCFGNMLGGFWMAQTGFFHQPEKFKRARTKLIMAGLLPGILASYVFMLISNGRLELSSSLTWLPYFIVAGMLLQSLAYIAGFIQLYSLKRVWKALLLLVAPVGKMALTNYLLQTFFYLAVFFHWAKGPGLYGCLTRTETYLLAIGFYLMQAWFSTWWLKRHGQGPVETAWKKISYKFSTRQ